MGFNSDTEMNSLPLPTKLNVLVCACLSEIRITQNGMNRSIYMKLTVNDHRRSIYLDYDIEGSQRSILVFSVQNVEIVLGSRQGVNITHCWRQNPRGRTVLSYK